MRVSKNIPKLRFKEFSDRWEKRKLESITEKVNSGKTPLGGESVYVPSGVLFIRSQNVLDSKLSLENSTYITEEVNDTMRNSIVKPKDILLNITGASLGRSCVVPNDFKIGNVNQHVCIVRLNRDNDPYFLQPIFASEKGQNLFTSLQTGSGREGLNFQSIKNLSLLFPTLPEQKKIATFLSAVDAKIQQLTRKKELLEQYKKGVMQQLFSGKLRFKDENGKAYPKWEEKRLGDVLEIGSGRDYKHLSQGSIPVFGTGGLMTYVNEFLYDGETVCIGRKGTIDKPMYYNGKIWTVDTLFYTHKFVNSFPKFIYYLFQQTNWKLYNEASGVPSLSKATIEKLKFVFPCKEEQQKIASYLTSIDTKIESVATQIAQSQSFKKGLLQQMFV